MLVKWLELTNDLTMARFLKLVLWQLWSTIGPIVAGLLKNAVHEIWTHDFNDDTRYGAATLGLPNEDAMFDYIMGFVLWTVIAPPVTITYDADEFNEVTF